MAVDFEVRDKLNEFLPEIAILPVAKFSPSKFAKYADITISESFNLLLQYVDTNELILIWELRCPNCHRILDISKSLTEEECIYCEEALDITANNLYPMFKISDKYKEHLKIKKFERAIIKVEIEDTPVSLANLTILDNNKSIVEKTLPLLIAQNVHINGVETMTNQFNATNQQNNIGDNNINTMNNGSDLNVHEVKQLLNDLKNELEESNQQNIIPLINKIEEEVTQENYSRAKTLLLGLGSMIGSTEALVSLMDIFGLIPN